MTRRHLVTGSLLFIAAFAAIIISADYVHDTVEAQRTTPKHHHFCLHEDSSGENWVWAHVHKCKSDQ